MMSQLLYTNIILSLHKLTIDGLAQELMEDLIAINYHGLRKMVDNFLSISFKLFLKIHKISTNKNNIKSNKMLNNLNHQIQIIKRMFIQENSSIAKMVHKRYNQSRKINY